MLIADVIRGILSNLPVLFFIVALVTAIAKIRRARLGRRPIATATIVWTELTFYYVGLTMIWAGIFHAYFQGIAAPQIGSAEPVRIRARVVRNRSRRRGAFQPPLRQELPRRDHDSVRRFFARGGGATFGSNCEAAQLCAGKRRNRRVVVR